MQKVKKWKNRPFFYRFLPLRTPKYLEMSRKSSTFVVDESPATAAREPPPRPRKNSLKKTTKNLKTMNKKDVIKFIIQTLLAILTAIGTTLGVISCL